MALVTLTTDFGLKDEYVGLMKGVILSINPALSMVDLTHGIDPGDVRQGAHLLAASFRYFPPGTVHLAVVDPGVGGERRILCMKAGGHLFTAPDNGLLSVVAAAEGVELLVDVKEKGYFLPHVSRTFHGRDIMAPISARLASGLCPRVLGPLLDAGELVPLAEASAGEPGRGTVIAVDRFGNLITDMGKERIENPGRGKKLRVRVGDLTISGIHDTYCSVPPGTPLALFGSRGYLEISVNRGNAQKRAGVEKGASVTVERE